ncbi:MAG TPA: SCO family protein [Azospirillaceae bacterium]|nr:SCO family protein [Azospirillaceae bacterium]
MKRRLLQVAFGSLLGLAIAFGVSWWMWGGRGIPSAGQASRPATVGTAQVGGPFELVDHTGRTVTDRDYAGRILLVFFGYTFCPDICPTELQTFAEVMDRLGPQADRVQPLFVTIDPARDTPAHLAQYVELFHPRIVGLTGTEAQIAKVARAYRVYYAKGKGADTTDYLMDHSTAAYLMGPDGAFVTVFRNGTTADAMLAEVRKLIPAS